MNRDALERLAHKYRTLAELRHDRARGLPIPERAIFKALAAEFPGALFELDHLPMEIIERRREDVVKALEDASAIADWMRFVSAYHELYRLALRIKARTRSRSLDDERAREIAVDTGADLELVRAVAAPPEGRIKPIVLARLATRFGVEVAAIEAAIFPRAPSSAKDEG